MRRNVADVGVFETCHGAVGLQGAIRTPGCGSSDTAGVLQAANSLEGRCIFG